MGSALTTGDVPDLGRESDAAPPARERGAPTAGDRAQVAALRAVVAVLRRVGFERAARVGESIGALGHTPLGVRRTVVEEQIAAAFPGWDRARVEATARAAYRHLGRTSIETALLPTLSRAQLMDLFERVDGWDVIEESLAKGKGLIAVSGHLGNWELGGAYVAARGVPIDVIVRHMANPLFDRYITSTRERIGMSVMHDDVAVRRVPRALRSGHVVAILADQATLGLSSDWVPFFGRPAKTPRGPAVFALRMGTPVVFGAVLRQPSGRYHLSFEPVEIAPTGDRERDVESIVAAYTAILERWVRVAPEQYFWHHRRWKHRPPAEVAERMAREERNGEGE